MTSTLREMIENVVVNTSDSSGQVQTTYAELYNILLTIAREAYRRGDTRRGVEHCRLAAKRSFLAIPSSRFRAPSSFRVL